LLNRIFVRGFVDEVVTLRLFVRIPREVDQRSELMSITIPK
jgi:hypothetical protein